MCRIEIKWLIQLSALAIIFNSLPVNSQHYWRHTGVQLFAGYNETCESTENGRGDGGFPCDPSKNLTCTIANICDCKSDSEDGLVFVHFPESNGCSGITRAKRVDFSGRCLTSNDCRDSIFGILSKCNQNSKCECYDSLTNGQKLVVLVNNRCQYFQNYGDVCEHNHECNGTIVGEAVCDRTNPDSNLKTCICHYDYVWDNKLQECVKIADAGLNFLCRSDLQCSHRNGLGELARCSDYTRHCECFDFRSNGEKPTAYHMQRGKCFYKQKINETCEDSEECKLGSSQLAICKEFDVNNSTKICQCKDEYVWGQTHEVNKENCLSIGKLHSPCTADQQCYHQNALGELSTCAKIARSKNPFLGQCECWDSRTGGDVEAGFHEGKCYFKRRVNETCDKTEECIIGYHKNAICSDLPNYLISKICVCPEDKKCSSAMGLFSSFGFTLVVTTVSYFYSEYLN